MLVVFHTSRVNGTKIRGTKESRDEPGDLFAQASNAVGDFLVDTPRLLRVDFALAELLFDSVETYEEN